MTGLAKNLDISDAIWSLLSSKKYLLPSVFFVSAALFPNGSFAGNFDGLPDGGKVDYGNVIIKKNNNQMEINQSSQKAIIEWENFDLDENKSLNFKQLDKSSSILNRVIGDGTSYINGKITSNGQVIITNENGVVFGKDAIIDVGGLIATSANLSNQNFLDSKFVFEQKSRKSKIQNFGHILTDDHGHVVLVSPEIVNEGYIVAKKGNVFLAGGKSVELKFDGNEKLNGIHVEPGDWQTLIENKKVIEVGEGQVILSASGYNELKGGLVRNSGQLSATSAIRVGGRIILVGEEIELASTSLIDTSGDLGGGDILIGGDWQGGKYKTKKISEEKIYSSNKVILNKGSLIKSDALKQGDGGNIVVWSDIDNQTSKTSVAGEITAKGGALEGNGGNIETSGYLLELNDYHISTKSTYGYDGNWLLDPGNINISNSGIDSLPGNSGPGGDTTISPTTISNALDFNNISIKTGSGNYNIDINDPISWTSSNNLTLEAGDEIIINANLSGNGGGDLTLISPNGILLSQNANVNISLNTGDLLLRSDHISFDGDYVSDKPAQTTISVGGLLVLESYSNTFSSSMINGYEGDVANILTWSGSLIDNQWTNNGSGDFVGLKINNFSQMSGLTLNKSTSSTKLEINSPISLSGPVSIYGGSIDVNANITANSGNILLDADTGSTLNQSSTGILLDDVITIETVTSGNLTLIGRSGDTGSGFDGIDASSANTTTLRSAGNLTLQGYSYAASGSGRGVDLNNDVIAASGTVSMSGQHNTGATYAISLSGSTSITAGTGVTLESLNDNTGTIALLSSGGIDGGSGTVLMRAANYAFGGADRTITTTGVLTIEPDADENSFASSFDNQYLNPVSVTGLTLGKSSNASAITLSRAISLSGPVSIYGGSIDVNANITANSGNILLDADTGSTLNQSSTGILLDDVITIETVTSGNLTLIGRSGDTGSGFDGIDASSANTTTLRSAGNLTLQGYSYAASGSGRGVDLNNDVIAASGTVSMSGQHNTGATYAISLSGSTSITAGTGVTLESLNDNTGTIALLSSGGIDGGSGTVLMRAANYAFGGADRTITTTGVLTIEPDADENSFASSFDNQYLNPVSVTGLTLGKSSNASAITLSRAISLSGPVSIYGGSIDVNANITANSGNILLDADTGSTLNQSSTGILLDDAITIETVTSGNLTLIGRSGDTGSGFDGIDASSANTTTLRSAGNLTLQGYSYAASGSGRGVDLNNDVIAASGTVSMTGQHNTGATYALSLSGSTSITAGTGVTLESLNNNTGTIALLSSGGINGGSGTVLMRAANYAFGGADRTITTTGVLTIQPDADENSFASSFDNQYLNPVSVTGLTLGKSSNASAITLSRAISLSGPVSIYGGSIDVNANITANSGNILLDADTGSTLNQSSTGILLDDAITIETVTSGNLTLIGRSGDTGSGFDGIDASSANTTTLRSAGNLTLQGYSYAASGSGRGVDLNNDVIAASGTVSMTGQHNTGATYALSLSGSTSITAGTGVTLESLNNNTGTIALLSSGGINGGSGTVLMRAANYAFGGADRTITTTGVLTIQPDADENSFASSFDNQYLNPVSVTGLTLGKSSNASAITLSRAISLSGPVSIYGGSIDVNANITANSGNILLDADTGSTLNQSSTGILLDDAITIETVTSGNLTLIGRSGDTGSGFDGIDASSANTTTLRSAGNLTLQGYSYAASGSGRGVDLNNDVIAASGTVSMTGQHNTGATYALSLSGSTSITAGTGVTLESLNNNTGTIALLSSGGINGGSGTVLMRAANYAFGGADRTITTTGEVKFFPVNGQKSFFSDFDTEQLNFQNITGLQIGINKNTSDVLIKRSLSVNGNIKVYAGYNNSGSIYQYSNVISSSTSGSVTFSGPLVLEADDLVISSGSGGVSFSSSIDSDNSSSHRSLSVTSTGGDVSLGASVGASVELDSVALTANNISLPDANTSILADEDIIINGTFLHSGSSAITGTLTAGDDIHFNGDIFASSTALNLQLTSGLVGSTEADRANGLVAFEGDIALSGGNLTVISASTYFQSAANQTVNTSGGELTFQGHTISSNVKNTLLKAGIAGGRLLTVNTVNGDFNVTGSIDSASTLQRQTSITGPSTENYNQNSGLAVNSGTGNISISAALGENKALAQINLTGSAINLSSTVSNLSNQSLNINNTANSNIYGVVSGSGASLIKNGSGSLFLHADNTFSGITTINAGELVIQNDSPQTQTSEINGTGSLKIISSADNFTGDFNNSPWNIASSISSLIIGKNGNNSNIILQRAININGPIAVNSGSIYQYSNVISSSTSGSVTFSGPLVLEADDLVISSGSGGVSFSSSIDSDNSSSHRSLSVTSTGGDVSLGASVGASVELDSVALTANNISLPDANTSILADEDIIINGTFLHSGSSAITGTLTAGDDIHFNGDIFASSTALNLQLTSGLVGSTEADRANGLVAFEGDIALSGGNLTVISASTYFQSAANQTVNTSGGELTFQGHTISSNVKNTLLKAGIAGGRLLTVNTVNGDFNVTGSIDSASTLQRQTSITGPSTENYNQNSGLAVNSGTGNISISAALGENKALAQINLNSDTATFDSMTSTGDILIETLTGNIVVPQSLTTSSNSANAIVINAGKNSNAGDASGGNVIISGSPNLTVGNGGLIKLYTGGISQSTGLVGYIGNSSGNFRYNSDEQTTNFTLNLTPNVVNAIYREAINLSVSLDDKTIVYGDSPPTFTATVNGLVNGDTLSYVLADDTIDISNYNVGSRPINTAGTTDRLGYSLNYQSGVFTVNPKTVSLAVAPKVYDASTDMTGYVSITTGVGGETLTYNGATSSDAHVATAGKYLNAITLGNASDGSGGLASNYQLPTLNVANAPITINPKTVSLAVAPKVYDASTDMTGYVSITTGVGGETLTYNGATSSDAHVATAGKYLNAITLGNASDGSGGLASNYQLPTLNVANAPITINPKTVSLAVAPKVYDASTDMTGYVSITTGVGGETLTYNGATSSDAHVATAGKYLNAITLGNASDGSGGLASNYQLPTLNVANAPITINPKTLTLTLTNSGYSQVYDGDSAADITPSWSFNGFISGDTSATIAYTGRNYNTANVTTANLITVSGLSITSVASSNSSAPEDYVLDSTTKTVNATITPKTVSLAVAPKVYDASTDMTGYVSITTGVGGETLTYNGATSSDAHVATAGKYLNAITLGNASDGSGGLASNYQLPTLNVANAPITINPKTVSLAVAPKVYDASTDMTGYVSITTGVGGETLTYNGATSSDVRVATAGKYLNAITLGNASDGSGGLASNYQLPTLNAANAPITINPKTLTLTLTNSGYSQVYDGDSAADITPSWSFNGFISGDTSALINYASKAYNNKDVAAANLITISGLTIDGITGGNNSAATDYILDANTKTVAATITRADLQIRANNDAKFVLQNDVVGYAGVSYSGFVGGETAADLAGTLQVTRNNAGTNLAAVYPSALEASGLTSGNYQISYIAGNYTIVPAGQLLVRVVDSNVTYGSGVNYAIDSVEYYNAASSQVFRLDNGSVSGSSVTIDANNLLAVNDGAGSSASFTLTPSNPVYSNANKLVVGSYSLGISGASTVNGGNFSNTITVTGAQQVNPKQITGSLSAGQTKVYDGNVLMPNAAIALGNVESGDIVTATGVSNYANKNVGTNKQYTVNNIQLAGQDNGNYSVVTNFLGNNGIITPKTVSLAVAPKVYDASTDMTGYVSITTGVGGETLTYNGATSSDAHVATAGKYLNAITLGNASDGSGGLASNYQLPTLNVANAPITINPKTVSLAVAPKVYDASTDMTGYVSITTGVGGETLTYNGATSSDAHVATAGKYLNAITLGNASDGSGGLASNYQLPTLNVANAPITINPKTVSLAVAPKVYDASTDMTGYVSITTGVGGETLTYNGATSSDAHVATAGKYLNAITLGNASDGSGGLASNYQLPTLNVANAPITINPKTLTLTLTNSGYSQVYDGDSAADITPSWSFNGFISGDTSATIAYTGRNYNTANVTTANLITVSGLSITSVASSNSSAPEDYVLDSTTKTVNATITPKTVSLAVAPKVYDASTDMTGYVSITTGVGGETLTYNGATSSDVRVATAGKYLNAITLGNASDGSGGLASNYQLPTLNAANAPITINPKTLTLTLTNSGYSQVYDGDSAADITPSWSFNGFISGDTSALINYASKAYNNKDVAAANLITISGLTIDGITGGNNSAATDYILDANTKTVAATITRADLQIRANNDAKFVLQNDVVGYAGVSYSGFVGGETAADLAGTLQVTRNNAGTNLAAVYPSALEASGLTSGNYQISYIAGNYTIVPAGQLLVRVVDSNVTYGSGVNYAIDSVEYYNAASSQVFRLDNGSVSGSSVTIDANNLLAVNDGAGSSASFTLTPSNPVYSNANKLVVGSYSLGISGASTVNGGNFSNTITVTGAQQVNPKQITGSLSAGQTKVYDGNVLMPNAAIALGNVESGDIVTATGVSNYANKNVGTNKQYTVNNIQLAGQDNGNYHTSSSSSFSSGVITAKSVTLTPNNVTKVYDGSSSYSASVDDLAFLTNQLGIYGDEVTGASLSFSDKNVSDNKNIQLSSVVISDDNSGNNYSLNLTFATGSSITILPSVVWVGGNTGNWFDPSNWAGGAVPDLSNVQNVIVPENVEINFDTSNVVAPADVTGPVNLNSLSGGGNLKIDSGNLNVGLGGMSLNKVALNNGAISNSGISTLTNLEINGGSFNSTSNVVVESLKATNGNIDISGNFEVTDSFEQSSNGNSNIKIGGSFDLTDSSGGLALGNIQVLGASNIQSLDGPISQNSNSSVVFSSSVNFEASKNGDPQNLVLDNPNNDFGGVVSASGGSISLADIGSLTLGTIVSENDFTVSSAGALDLGTATIGGSMTATSSGGNITQSGSLSVASAANISAGSGQVALSNASNNFGGVVSASGGSISLADIGSLTLGTIVSENDFTVSSAGALDLGTATIGGSMTATSSGGNITQSGSLSIASTANISAGSGQVALSNASNNFGGVVSASGGSISLADIGSLTLGTIVSENDFTVSSAGALDLGTATIGGSMTATSSGGNITQSGSLSIASTANISAGSGQVALSNASNNFGGVVSASGGSISLADIGSLTLGTIVSENDFTVSSAGALDLGTATIGGSMTATSSGGNITQSGSLSVASAANISAGSGQVALSNASNNFGGVVSASGGSISLADIGSLTLGTIVSENDFTVSSAGALDLGTATIGGSMTATSSGGNITQSGSLSVASTANISAGSGQVALSNTSNNFGGVVSASGGSISLADIGSLTLGTIVSENDFTVSSAGALDLGTATIGGSMTATSSGGNITQSGSLSIASTANISAGSGQVALSNASNNFGGVVSASGGSISLADIGSLTLGTIVSENDFTVSSAGALDLGTATIGGSMTATSSGGNITQSGSLSVASAANISAGSGQVALSNTSNNFGGVVSASGGSISLANSGTLTLGAIDTDGEFSISSSGGVGLNEEGMISELKLILASLGVFYTKEIEFLDYNSCRTSSSIFSAGCSIQ